MKPTPTSEEYAISKIHTVIRRTCADFKVNVIERGAAVKLNALCRAKMTELAQRTRLFMENAGRTRPHSDDVLAAFKMKHVDLETLFVFTRTCTGIEPAWSRFQFPVADRKTEHFEGMYGVEPSARELKFRPENIPTYHRALHPEWIEKKVVEEVKKIPTITEEEFNALRAPSYPWKETPETQKRRMEKERIQDEAAAHARARNQERFREGITGFRDTELPNFEDMEFGEFHEDRMACRKLDEQAAIQEEMKELDKKKKIDGGQLDTKKRGPNILQKKVPKERPTTILLDRMLPLVVRTPQKPPSSSKKPSTSRPTPPPPTFIPPTLSPTTNPGPRQHKTPTHLEAVEPKTPRPGRPKKQRAEMFDPSPVESPSTSSRAQRSLETPSPKLTTPAKFTPPLRPHSSRQRKPRAETFDPSPVPKNNSAKKQVDVVAMQQMILDQVQRTPQTPIATEHTPEPKGDVIEHQSEPRAPLPKLKIKFSSDYLSTSGPLEASTPRLTLKLPVALVSLDSTPRSPLKLRLNLSAIRAKKQEIVDEEEEAEAGFGGKENGDNEKKTKNQMAPVADVVVEEPIAYCPLCRLTYPDEQLIGCDACGEWFHWQCVGVLEEPTTAKWYCPECVKKRKKKTSSGKRPSTSSTSKGGSTPAKRGRPGKK